MTPQEEADMLFAKASQLHDAELYDEAGVQFAEYVKRFPESNSADNAKLQIANGYFQQGKYDQAVAAYKEVVDNYPQSDASDRALLSVGDAYFAQQKYNEAIESYRKVLDKYPRLGTQIAISAQDRINALKDIEEDMKILSEGKEEDKDNAQYDIADIYFTVYGDYERARAEFQKVVDRWPKSELADDALWKIADCCWNIASRELPSRIFSREQQAYIKLTGIYDHYPQLTKMRLFHLDVHWPVVEEKVSEYDHAYMQTRRIINEFPLIAKMTPVDVLPENYRRAFTTWRDITNTYSNSDRAPAVPARVARAFVDLGNLYYNMGQKHFASLLFRESLLTMPTPEGHLGMARYYGNITSVAAPPWAYRRAFYHIKKAAELTPPDTPMADKVSWAKEWMNYKMRIEGLEVWPDRRTQ